MSRLLTMLFVAVVVVTGLPIGAGAGTVHLKLKPDRPVVEAGVSQTVRVKVAVTGDELPEADRPPVNLSIVIDKSGSMRGQRIAYARLGAIEAIRRLGSEDIFSVVVFDREVRTLIPAQRLTDVAQAERIINSIQAGGTTNIHGGMMAGYEELHKNLDADYLNRAVLLSDGLANVGPTRPEAFAELGHQFASSGIVISTIGLGHNFNERLLASLAQASEGNNYFVQDPQTLTKIFEAEIGHLVSTVATGVTITIELPAGVTLQRVLGRHYRQMDNRIEIDFHDLAGGSSKYSLLELTVPAGGAGEVLDALEARAVYRRVADGQEAEVSSGAQLSYTESRQEAEAAMNLDVQDAWVELHQATVQDEVLDMVERGQRHEARQRLERLAAEAEQAGIAGPAADRLKSFSEREQRILEDRDYSRQETLERRTDAYQVRQQQQVGRVGVDENEHEQSPQRRSQP